LERALAVQEVLDPEDKRKRCDLLLALGEALMPAGEPLRAANETAEEAFALAQVLNDNLKASEACRIALIALLRYGGPIQFGTLSFRKWALLADRYAEPATIARVYAKCSASTGSDIT
jgi:hypothetical protein